MIILISIIIIMKAEEKKSSGLAKDWKKMQQKEYQGHKKRIYALGWNSRGDKLVTSSSDHTVRVGLLNTPAMEYAGRWPREVP